MPKSARIDLRIDPELKARVEALAAERGQTLTVLVERSLEATLAAAVPPVTSSPIPATQWQSHPDAQPTFAQPTGSLGKGYTPPRPKAGR